MSTKFHLKEAGGWKKFGLISDNFYLEKFIKKTLHIFYEHECVWCYKILYVCLKLQEIEEPLHMPTQEHVKKQLNVLKL